MMRLQGLGSTLLVALIALGQPRAQAWTPQRLGVDKHLLAQHLLPGQFPDAYNHTSSIELLVEVDTRGKVASVRWPVDDYGNRFSAQHRAALLAVARNLRFKPFALDGHPVTAVGHLALPYAVLRGEKWADAPHRPFPPIRPDTEIEISLARFATCWGPCPAHAVRIDGQGNVLFDGGNISQISFYNTVMVPGQFRTHIAPAIVKKLVEQFRQERFLDMLDEYDGQVSDGRSSSISLRIGNIRKRVWEGEGEEAGMPPAYRRLEQAIEQAAGADRWVMGNAHTLAFLRGAGVDFSGEKAIPLLRAALARRSEDVLLPLTEENLPWDLPVPDYLITGVVEQMERPPVPLGQFLLTWAIRLDLGRLFTRMRILGWLDRTPLVVLETAFRESRRCNPVIDDGLRTAGVDLSRRNAETVFPYDGGVIPLPVADAAYLACLQDALRADPERADIQTFALQSPALTHWLITKGHRPRLYDEKGQLPYLETGQDALLLTLLEAGSDPRGPDGTAQALRELAGAKPLPATLEWLDAHGIQ